MQLICSSLIAMIVDECTMVRWGVRPRCRQLRIYCKDGRVSTDETEPGRHEQSSKSELPEAETGGKKIWKGHSNNQKFSFILSPVAF